eukprot:542654_1
MLTHIIVLLFWSQEIRALDSEREQRLNQLKTQLETAIIDDLETRETQDVETHSAYANFEDDVMDAAQYEFDEDYAYDQLDYDGLDDETAEYAYDQYDDNQYDDAEEFDYYSVNSNGYDKPYTENGSNSNDLNTFYWTMDISMACYVSYALPGVCVSLVLVSVILQTLKKSKSIH